MSTIPNAIDARDLLANVISDLTAGEAIFPESAEAIARAVSDAMDGVRDLERTLASMTAQRDQCKSALEEASCCNILLSNHIIAGSDYFPKRQSASSEATRAALRACDEKGGAE